MTCTMTCTECWAKVAPHSACLQLRAWPDAVFTTVHRWQSLLPQASPRALAEGVHALSQLEAGRLLGRMRTAGSVYRNAIACAGTANSVDVVTLLHGMASGVIGGAVLQPLLGAYRHRLEAQLLRRTQGLLWQLPDNQLVTLMRGVIYAFQKRHLVVSVRTKARSDSGDELVELVQVVLPALSGGHLTRLYYSLLRKVRACLDTPAGLDTATAAELLHCAACLKALSQRCGAVAALAQPPSTTAAGLPGQFGQQNSRHTLALRAHALKCRLGRLRHDRAQQDGTLLRMLHAASASCTGPTQPAVPLGVQPAAQAGSSVGRTSAPAAATRTSPAGVPVTGTSPAAITGTLAFPRSRQRPQLGPLLLFNVVYAVRRLRLSLTSSACQALLSGPVRERLHQLTPHKQVWCGLG